MSLEEVLEYVPSQGERSFVPYEALSYTWGRNSDTMIILRDMRKQTAETRAYASTLAILIWLGLDKSNLPITPESRERPPSNQNRKYAWARIYTGNLQGIVVSRAFPQDSRPLPMSRTRSPVRTSQNPTWTGTTHEVSRQSEERETGKREFVTRMSSTTILAQRLTSTRDFTLDWSLRVHHTHPIALSGAIGTGLFIAAGEGASIFGPIALFSAHCFAALVQWSMLSAMTEMITLFPLPGGGFFGYPRRFVDDECDRALSFLRMCFWAMLTEVFSTAAASLSFLKTVHSGTRMSLWLSVVIWITIFLTAFRSNGRFVPGSVTAYFGPWVARLTGRSPKSGRVRRSSRVRHPVGNAMLLSILLYASPAQATPANIDIEPSGGTEHCFSLLTTLRDPVRDLIKLWATPQTLPRTFPPQTLLLGTLLSTTFTVLLFSLIRSKPFTKHFLLFGLVASSLGGANFAVDVPDFVFRYLFVGVNVALVGSLLYHGFYGKGRGEGTRNVGDAGDIEGNSVFEKEKGGLLG